jgi:hypothetical protein
LNRAPILLILITILLISVPAAAQSILDDPQIPDGERIEFRVSFGEDVYTLISEVALLRASGEEIYKFTNSSPNRQVTVELSRSTLATRSVATTGSQSGLRFETVTRIEPRSGEQSDRIEAINLDDLMLKLRGFAFSSHREAPVLFVNGARGGEDSFAPRLTLRGKEKLRIGTRTVEAHKLELIFSAPGLWRAFGLVPRTFFWYGIEPPHALLRVETTEVPGSPRWLLEVVYYSGWK